jgi:hypothetical protein
MEDGEVTPTLQFLLRIAKELDASIAAILFELQDS